MYTRQPIKPDDDVLSRQEGRWKTRLALHIPGLIACVTVAIAAQFLSEHYGVPAMLMALLLGFGFHFLSQEGRAVPGIAFTGQTVLRIGVALLGARMSLEILQAVGAGSIVLIIVAVAATIGFGLLLAHLLGQPRAQALLTGGSVAICGASAAMAISAILPRSPESERNLIFTVIGVTVLSTVAMIAYPVLASLLGLDDRSAGIFLGATIHDVAQVVGAGFTISQEAGETATVVKLLRVMLLAPVVVIFALVMQRGTEKASPRARRQPLIPLFVIGFMVLAVLNGLGLIPDVVEAFFADTSRWALLAGIAAVGMKTSLKSLLGVGYGSIGLIVAETLFLATFILAGLYAFGLRSPA